MEISTAKANALSVFLSSSQAQAQAQTTPDPEKEAEAQATKEAAIAAIKAAVRIASDSLSKSSAEAPNNTGDDSDKVSLIDQIRETGFQAYTEEIKQEKLEKLREELLEAMGLTEEDLAKMPPEQRQAIEEAINDEIQRRMAAASEMNDSNKSPNSGVSPSLIASPDNFGGSMSVLIALQEVDPETDPQDAHMNTQAGPDKDAG